MKFLSPILLFLLAGWLAAEDFTLGEERDAAFRLQIFLDQERFGPGAIDGRPGLFTQRAIEAYNSSLGRNEQDVATLQAEADAALSQTFVTATVPSFASEYVNPKLPYKRSEQAKEKALNYRSYYEFMAERYHTSERVLFELNGRSKTYGARPGKTLVVPNVQPFLIEDLRKGKFHKGDQGQLSARRIVISTKNKQVQIYEPLELSLASNAAVAVSPDLPEKYQLVASFPTTPGQERFIHRGTWKLKNLVEWPTWRYDPQLLKTGKRSKKGTMISGGPNNPVGVVWAGLSKSGIGIHGTDNPRTIGRARSSGCYRLANWDVARLSELVLPGATVIVE